MMRDPDATALSARDLIKIIIFGGIAITVCYAMGMYVVNLYSSLSTGADDIEVPEWFSFALLYFFLLIFALLVAPLLVRSIPRIASARWRHSSDMIWLLPLLFFAIPAVCGVATSLAVGQIALASGYKYCTTRSSTGFRGQMLSTSYYTKVGGDDVCSSLLLATPAIPPSLAPFYKSTQPPSPVDQLVSPAGLAPKFKFSQPPN